MTFSKKDKTKSGLSDPLKISKLGKGFLNEKDELRNSWKALLIKYHDRLMFSTDAHKKHWWKKYSKIVIIYRDILNQLPEAVSKKIAYLNAQKIYGIKLIREYNNKLNRKYNFIS